MTKFDAIVIGSGQAGNPLSQKLADQGWTVALIEQGHLGGTCVNTGCTPTKTMIASAQVAHYARRAGRWGVQAADVRADLLRIVARKDQIVGQWRSGLEKKIQDRKTCIGIAAMPASSRRTAFASKKRSWRAIASSSMPAPGEYSAHRGTRPG